MRTFKFVADKEQRILLTKIGRFCDWAESGSGRHALLYKDDHDSFGQMAQSELGKLRQTLCQLFDGWPEGDFFVDLRQHCYPIDAYCEMADVVRQIEESRGLSKDALWSRLCILSADGNSEEEMLAFAAYEEQVEVPTRIEDLQQQVVESSPFNNPFVTVFAEMGL